MHSSRTAPFELNEPKPVIAWDVEFNARKKNGFDENAQKEGQEGKIQFRGFNHVNVIIQMAVRILPWLHGCHRINKARVHTTSETSAPTPGVRTTVPLPVDAECVYGEARTPLGSTPCRA
jgi:hypothetical protein